MRTDPPRVRVALGCKINIGNFQNVDLNIAVEDSMRETEKSIDEATRRVYDYVEQIVTEKLEEHVAEMSRLAKFPRSKSAQE
jgi:hypothetical protein